MALTVVKSFPQAEQYTGAARKEHVEGGLNADATNGAQQRFVISDNDGLLLVVTRGTNGATVFQMTNGTGLTRFVSVNDAGNGLLIAASAP